MFTRLQENLANKLNSLTIAEEKLKNLSQIADAISWIKSNVIGKEFVLFCGAGISIPCPASAPGFLELRDSLVIAMVQTLLERGAITRQIEGQVLGALRELPGRKLNFPPEMVFSCLKDSFGDKFLAQILACLNQGKPNENHMGIRQLAEQPGSGLAGVITTNFDVYIEEALDVIPHTVHLPDTSEGDIAFPLVKPHGSLKSVSSIIVTLEDLWTPLRQPMRDMIKRLISNRTVLVIGYSGLDYDLFPLLVYAGRHWNTRIVWVLWNREALNSQVGKICLALGDRCTVLDGQQNNILAGLNDLGTLSQPTDKRNIVSQFAEAMKVCTIEDLISAFIEFIGPLGVPDYSRICQHVLEVQLAQLRRYGRDYDLHRLNLILQAAKFSENKSLRRSAAQLGKQTALAAHHDKWLEQFRYYETVKSSDDDPDAELRDLEFLLQSDFFPYLEMYTDAKKARLKRYMTLGELSDKAELLWEKDEYDEAEKIVRRLLVDYRFPETGISEDACLYDETAKKGRLHYILARLLIERNETEEAEKELCSSLDILWQELNTFQLSSALDIVRELLDGSLISNRCKSMAFSLAIGVARLDDNFINELEDLVTKLESGLGNEQDLERARVLLIQAKITGDRDVLDYEELEERTNSAEAGWFRNGQAVFLKRMLEN